MKLAFDIQDDHDNHFSVIANVGWDSSYERYEVDYTAAWRNGVRCDTSVIEEIDYAFFQRAYERAIHAFNGDGQSEVWFPFDDALCAALVADCENFDRIIFKDLRTVPVSKTPAIDKRRASIEARAIKVERELRDLAAILAFPISGETCYQGDDKLTRVMWAVNGFKYAGTILMHTLDAERILQEVRAEMAAPPVRVTLHETI